MLLLQAHYLLPQAFHHPAQRIYGRRVVGAIVHRIHREQRVCVRECVIETHRPEIFANGLQWMAEGLRDPSSQFRSVLYRPQREQRLDAGNSGCPRRVVRNQRHIAQTQMLPESLIIREYESLVLLDRPSQRAAKFVALKLRNRAMIEKVARVQIVVSQELV